MASEQKCKIEWIDCHDNPTPDDNAAIGIVTCNFFDGSKPVSYPICADHARSIGQAHHGQCQHERPGQGADARWTFQPFPPSDYLVEVRFSDGNDASVSDYLVTADTPHDAQSKVFDAVLADSPKDTEEDGDFGAWYPCDCAEHCSEQQCPRHDSEDEGHEDMDCSLAESCEGHGGFTVGEPEPFPPAEHARYHSLVDLRDAS